MPWWGWLIAGCVAFFGLTVLVVVRMMTRAMAKIDEGWR